MEENSDYVSDDPMNHPVFYSVCQALFFIVTARHKDFIGTKNSKYYESNYTEWYI